MKVVVAGRVSTAIVDVSVRVVVVAGGCVVPCDVVLVVAGV